MSVQIIQNKLEQTQRDINLLQQKLTDETKKESLTSERMLRVKQSISRTTSPSTVRNKLSEIGRLERDIVAIQKKKAEISKRITSKTADLNKMQQQLLNEQGREYKKLQDMFKQGDEKMRRMQAEQLHQASSSTTSRYSGDNVQDQEENPFYDVFISHASEDKDDLVRPLAEKLQEVGFSVWYDEFQLKVGENLRRSIDRGLANSRFGIVVLSPAFFEKNWPQYELDGLIAREMSGSKVILPLWHKVSKNEVMSRSPSLVDKIALNTSMYTIEEIVEKLAEAVR
ncbi:MAG TPA: TIR domain-containing protein [Herpetosiphonaceae bacterium]